MSVPSIKAPFARLSLLFFLQPLSYALWILPFGNVLAAHRLQALVPVLFAMPPIAMLFAPLLAGIIADHKIPSHQLLRRLLLGSSTLMFCAMLALKHGHPWLLMAAIAAYSILVTPVETLATAIVLAHSSNPAKHFPFYRIWATIAWIVAGYLISFGIDSDFSTRAMIAASICELCLALYTFTLPSMPAPNLSLHKTGWRQISGLDTVIHFPGDMLKLLLLMVAVIMSLSAAFFPYAPQMLKSAGIAKPSAWMTLAQWSEILFIGILPWLVPRIKPQWLMFLGLLCGGMRCLCFVAFTAWGGWVFAATGLLMHGPITAFTFVALQIFMEKNLPAVIRNRSQALVGLFGYGIGTLSGLLLSGALASVILIPGKLQPHSWISFWGGLGLLHIVMAGIFFLWLRKIKSSPPISQG